MNASIKHIWFDFSETLVSWNKEKHKELRYETYAEVTGKPHTPKLEEEFEALLKKHKSNAAAFNALGLGSGFWSDKINSVNPEGRLELTDKNIPTVLKQLREIVPISIWSNIHTEPLLPSFGIDPTWFTHFLTPDEVRNPKPALDGFKLMIERSQVPPENILFVGDSLDKEIRPGKTMGIQTGLIWSASPEADYCFSSFQEILDLVK